MRGISIAVLLLAAVVAVFAGSECPDRVNIYPCACIYLPQGKKKFETLLVCHNLQDKEQLSSILKQFKKGSIDKFFMYDSYYGPLEAGHQRTLPGEVFNLQVKEIDVIDSNMESCFACEFGNCGSSDIIKFKVRNSTLEGNFCSFCNNENRLPWLTCMQDIQHLDLSHGILTKLNMDFFPTLLPGLKVFNLSHNKINKIEEGFFRNIPHLKKLDLSYNKMERLDRIFNARSEIEFFDLSHNAIVTLGSSFMPALPKVKILILANNKIEELKHSEWRRISKNVTRIDLSNNGIACDCNLQWLNHTIAVRTVIEGHCATPDIYKDTRLRRASIYMNERCDENNVIGERKKNPK